MRKADEPATVPGPGAPATSGEATLVAQDHHHTLAYVLLGLGTLMLAGALHIHGPLFALLLVGAGWYLLRTR